MTNGPDPRAARDFAEWLRNREHYPDREKNTVPDDEHQHTPSSDFAAFLRGQIER
ncbi:hypothetical protein PSD17_66630 [Pseudonocardia sp. D17]|nr:hypothetical protein PSD17_66630 [Pseudonocardia sp. D17]